MMTHPALANIALFELIFQLATDYRANQWIILIHVSLYYKLYLSIKLSEAAVIYKSHVFLTAAWPQS